MVKLDPKGSIDHGLGQGAFLVAPFGRGFGLDPPTCPAYPPPGLPAIVHHLLGLASCCAALGYPVVCQSLLVVRPPIARASMVEGILDE